MAIYCALLRGINVSGHNMIKMAELKKMFEQLGYERVQTYINSGNILFESEESMDAIQSKLEQGISNTFGLQIAVILRTDEEIKGIIATCPFSEDQLAGGKKVYITMLRVAPTQADYDKMPEVEQGQDLYHIIDREVYVYYQGVMHESKLTKKFQKLMPQTTRNWNTMQKLYALTQAMKA
ncbi:DUF1697 domain-containing protein [Paenibacillus sp. N1-5-1-14]|uniref:DUF1697 domain-containing protein n=1 Tax=Paenibacillus radicibacter TaxID=2972488 RepID=UPI002158B283|nr:DUF1697 domain-containing protein [Paenibacillus radicibacter]MCR8641661.1 DUF1697 domain-containing protein [Paenibacillus radicibacter]